MSEKVATTKADRFKNSRAYWHAFVAFWGMVLFGYDTGVAGGVVANEFFREYFGLIRDGVKDQILTTVASGPNGLAEIYAGRVISGIGIGAISAVAPAYVSECAPKDARGRITGVFQIMVVTGVMLSYFINYGIGVHIPRGEQIWKIPFGVQLIPSGLMCLGLLTVKESPRWLASVGRTKEALKNLAYLRKGTIENPDVLHEMAEIEATIEEERVAREGLGVKEAFLGKGNFIRFVIAFVVFLGQQLTGQNSIKYVFVFELDTSSSDSQPSYYAPQIFESIGYTSATSSLLASGIYGVLKVVATTFLVLFVVDSMGRKRPFLISAVGMAVVFFITGAILKTHPPPPPTPNSANNPPPPASQAMAAMIYFYVIFYSLGWGGLPWIYSSEIFPTRTRHYGLAVASASQWLWNFVISKATPSMLSTLGYKIFFMYGAFNLGLLATFAILIPETKGRSLEDMDVIFGSITAEQRQEDIKQRERALELRPSQPEAVSMRQESMDEKV
ncbi:hypothetical protein ONZ45_g5224 [Pleurotus djamor]|nr:hypothetical protein ONZ45_g5224 [Pleurotus djamor]